MATESIKIVDPDQGAGHDYHNLVDWESGEQGDLTGVRDEIAIAKCRCTSGGADNTTNIIIDGWTTSATQYIKIWTDPAESYRHTGKWDATKYRLITHETHCFRLNEEFVRIHGIQIHLQDTSYRYALYIYFTGTGSVQISECICKADGATGNQKGINADGPASGTTFYFWNNVFYDFVTSGITVSAGTAAIYSSTFHNCGTGIVRDGGTLTTKNCIFDTCTTDTSGTNTETYCATTNDNTKGLDAAGAGNRFSQTFSFVDGANGDFHLQSTDTGSINLGTNTSGESAPLDFTTDIDGVTRSGTWDIGADEYVSSGTSVSITDSGSASDSLTPASVSFTRSDSGSGVDILGPIQAAIPTISDTGAGADILGAVGLLISLLDSGAAADALGSVGVSLSVPDIGAGADFPVYPSVQTSVPDTGSALDALASLLATLPTIPDTGQGVDSALQMILIQIAETGSGADALTQINVQVAVSETGSAADAVSQLSVTFSLSDAGAAVDAINVMLPGLVNILDTALGIDSISPAIASVTVADVSSAIDTPSILVTVPVIGDTASAIDTILKALALALSDSGAGVDSLTSVSVHVPISDDATAIDLLTAITAVLSVVDAGAGTDTALNLTLAGDYKKLTISFSGKKGRLSFTGKKGKVTFDA